MQQSRRGRAVELHPNLTHWACGSVFGANQQSGDSAPCETARSTLPEDASAFCLPAAPAADSALGISDSSAHLSPAAMHSVPRPCDEGLARCLKLTERSGGSKSSATDKEGRSMPGYRGTLCEKGSACLMPCPARCRGARFSR